MTLLLVLLAVLVVLALVAGAVWLRARRVASKRPAVQEYVVTERRFY